MIELPDGNLACPEGRPQYPVETPQVRYCVRYPADILPAQNADSEPGINSLCPEL
ncbi:hypothetical protein DPMN_168882 [Dreissena polymorpha]|uniref:Uncharacterized protein n=1 Tax=Dreissena polymorpha TaxID=45954 RepID=A0A9D4F5Z9_DREPO|nr:hypothetical protein DPMN_168882 [Dreissena polymorpha]